MDQNMDQDWNSDSDIDLGLGWGSDTEDPERPVYRNPAIHAITSSNEYKAKIQVSTYENITLFERFICFYEYFLAHEEEIPNTSASVIQDYRKHLAWEQERLNIELENFLNCIGFHNTYDAFAPHSSK